MRRGFALLSGLLLTVCTWQATAEKLIRVGTYQDHVPAIKAFLSEHGCQPLPEADVRENQILAEFLIFCNALKHADRKYRIRLYPYPLNARVLDDIERGFLSASAMGIWRNELRGDHVEPSAPLFKPGQFTKGFYTTEGNQKVLGELPSLNGKVVLANSNWYHDWTMLSCSGMKTVHIDQYENMFRMLSAGRGDMIPLTFSNRPGFARNHFGVMLYPVPGYKMVFSDSTHFAVRHDGDPQKTLLSDLNQGLSLLREEGQISALYQRLGILNPAVSDWQQLGQCGD